MSPKGRISHLPEQSCWLYVLIAQKILSIGKLVELKMPDLCDCTRLGISILVSAADLSIKSIYRSRFGLNFSKHKKNRKDLRIQRGIIHTRATSVFSNV